VIELERERLKESVESAAVDDGIEAAPQELKTSSTNQLKLIINEMIDKLGPLPDEEITLIREWLELGS
jgi:hypothetical protein